MKRLLSLVLAVVMLLSLLPVYAAPAEGGSGITVKYDITSFEGAAKDVNTKGLDYADTYGFWKHRPAGKNRDAKIATYGELMYVKYGPGNTIGNEYSDDYAENDYFVAYEINVPESGKYDITLHNMQCNAYGATTQLYILPAETADSALSAFMKSEDGKAYKFGNEVEFYNNDITKTYLAKDEPLGEKYFDAGKYIVAYAATAKNGDTAPGNAQMNICGITLDGGSGTVPMSIRSELDKTVIAPDGGTAKMTVTAIMSDGKEEDYTDKVEYSVTGNAAVAQDGTVTGGDVGEATVTAKLELSGRDALTTSQTVKVASTGARIFYDVGTLSTAVTSSEPYAYLTAPTYITTDGFYKYYGTNQDISVAGTSIRTRYKSLQLSNNRAAVYEVYIPAAGSYTMEMYNSTLASAKSANVYLSTAAELEKNGGVYKSTNSNYAEQIKASLGTYIGSYDCALGADSKTFQTLVSKPNVISGFNIPEPGYYTIAFYADGGNVSVGDFWLTSGIGEAVPMKRTITGLDTGFAEVEILLSDKTYVDLSNATFDWKSSDESVVYIDDDGIMDINKIGETEISVDIYMDGKLYDTVSTKHTVTELPAPVSCAGTVQKYDFLKVTDWDGSASGAYKDAGQETDDVRGITKEYTDGNWWWFGEGPAGRTSRVVTTYGQRLQLYPANRQWTGFTIKVDKAGKYFARLEYYAYNTAGDSDIYIVPKPEKIRANPDDPEDTSKVENIAAVDELLHRKNYVGYANFINPAQSGWATMNTDLGVVDIPEAGEYVLVFKQGPVNGYLRPRVLTLDGINDLKLVSFTAPQTEITYGKTVETSISASLLDGTVLGEDEYEVLYESSDTSLATVDKNGAVTGKGHGEVTITATARKDNAIVQKSIVFNAIDDTDIKEKRIKLDDSLYVGEKAQISVVLSMESGNEITLPREDITFTTDKDDVLRFEEAGYVFAAKETKSVTILASGTFRGEPVSVDKEISVVLDEGKTESTYYTTKKRENALENAATYDWAKSMKKSAEKTADEHINNLDILYDMIIAEGLPRSIWRGAPSAPNYNICRYCDGGTDNKGSDFVTNVIARPWQTQCPECKRLFPSNDFESFLQLGLDREKHFSRIRALEAHRAMLLEMGKELPDAGITEERKAELDAGDLITAEERAHYGFGVDGGYLVNELYPELADPAKVPATLNNKQGLRAGEDWKTWGVDDGYGYIPLREDGVTPYQYELTSGDSVTYIQERHVYAAHINSVMMTTVVGAVEAIKEAYLYTGDIKYGRAGAILLDRIADVYHTYDLFTHNYIDWNGDEKPDRVWHNTDGGGTGIGVITGRIDANNQAQSLALCADAFYPVLTDTQVIDYLSEKAEIFGYDKLTDDDKYDYHEYRNDKGVQNECDGDCREYEHEMRRNAKTSSHDIWKNWENGILRKNYWGVKYGRIVGNFGQRQATTSITAIVQDRQPETTEMLEWIYQQVDPDNTYRQGGGGVTSQLIDVIDRDGMGHESSTNYNRTQIEGLGKMSDFLASYKDGAKYNLYENPKFREMFMAFVRPVTPPGHPHIGDVSSTLYHGNYSGDIEIWKKGFKELRDTDIADELAQYIWTRNNRTTEGLHYDIFTEDPESFEDDVAALIDETGALESDLMAGWGFAVLRDGGIYESASASTEANNMRDFWITAGDTDGHGHPDALTLNVDAYGLNLGADLGYPEETSYTANRLQWVCATISHNTVLINQKNSIGDEVRGFPLHFNDSGMVKLMDIDATHKYAEAENYRRSLVMVKINDDTSYGVDFFRVTGGNHHTYVYHSASSKVNEVSGLSMATEPELIQVDKDGTMDYATYAGEDAAYVKNPDGSVRRALPGEEVDFETVFPVTYGQDPWTQPAWTYDTMFPRGYTWLRNVRRAAEPQSSFTVDFEISDYRKAVSNPKGIHLRMTQINDFTPTGVAFAGGHVPQKSASSRNVGYKDAFDSERATMLEYVYIEREAEEGQELDSLFTTVYEPYRNTSNIGKIEAVDVTKVSGTEQDGDMVRAVKVTHVGGERIDYVVYATNNSVKYNVGGVFDFRGFVGVYSTNSEGAPTYRYVHDGNIIGDEVESEGTLTGKVEGFERELAFKNYIDISAEIEDTDALVGEYIFIANDGADNAVYKIEGASVLENHGYGDGKNVIRLDIDRTTLIRGHQNASNPELGYVYNISAGQSFEIPLSYNEDFSPEFEPVSSSLTTSAGSSISVALSAQSPVKENAPTITYIGTTLPRGASINAETGVFTWKPDSSQIGENHVAITARDSDGRESTVHFTVTVYGSTTGGSSSNNSNEAPSENTGTSGDTSTPAGGSGGGGGGAPETSDKTNTDEKNDEGLLTPEKEPSAGEADEVENIRFTDLGNHAWAADAINALADDGIVKGTTASMFSPAANITRADFALLLVRAFNLTSDNAENFADVSASDYFASELAIARNTGIVNGIGDNKFAPRNTITRQDMMVIVYRALQASLALKGSEAERNVGAVMNDSPVDYQNRDVTEPCEMGPSNDGGGILSAESYPDFTAVAPYAKDAVSALISAGIVNGKNNLIAPTDYTTRAEVAVLIKRIMDYVWQ